MPPARLLTQRGQNRQNQRTEPSFDFRRRQLGVCLNPPVQYEYERGRNVARDQVVGSGNSGLVIPEILASSSS